MFSWMDGADQLAVLLGRWISPTPEDTLLSALANSSDDTLQRVAYFISAQPGHMGYANLKFVTRFCPREARKRAAAANHEK